MSRLPALAFIAAAALLAACKPAAGPGGGDFPTLQLNDTVGAQVGGPSTCVVMLDAASGGQRYQYGLPSVCSRPLPPCATIDLPGGLIGIDAGLVTPQTVLKWDGSPQQVSAWEKDADMVTAFRQSNDWWRQALAAKIGSALYGERLKAYGYGSGSAQAPMFWSGPDQGGTWTVSTRQQAQFLQKLYLGRLPAKPEAAKAMVGMLTMETRGAATVSGKNGSCNSMADASRSVGWWVGRLTTPDRDLVIAASIEGESALPGFEVETRMKVALADAGLWPAQ